MYYTSMLKCGFLAGEIKAALNRLEDESTPLLRLREDSSNVVWSQMSINVYMSVPIFILCRFELPWWLAKLVLDLAILH
jgi:hypothetical protein